MCFTLFCQSIKRCKWYYGDYFGEWQWDTDCIANAYKPFFFFFFILQMADVTCSSSLPGSVFLREDTCSPLITHSVTALIVTWTHTQKMRMLTSTDAQLHIAHMHRSPPPSHPWVQLCMDVCASWGTDRGEQKCWKGFNGRQPFQDEARCYDNCIHKIQWLFLQLARP